MKKYILSAALFAVLLAGCNKTEATPEIISEEPQMMEIKAEILATKTTYDNTGKFSWLSADKMTLVVQQSGQSYNHYTFNNSTGDGATAVFTGSTPSGGWEEYGVALYPNVNVSTKNALKEAGSYGNPLQVVLEQEIAPSLNNPLEVVPLIGRKNAQDVYQFKTATGILAITVSNIPVDAYYLYLQDPSGTYAFSGTFEIGDKNEICAADAVSPSGNAFKKTIAFTPEAAGETRTFYFPVPTGTIPAGITLKLDKGYPSYENIMTVTTKDPITVTANHVTPLGTVPAESWKTLGTGKFLDDDGFYATGGPASHVDVTIQQHATNTSRYRVVNPYQVYIDANGKTLFSGAAGPDPYFYFELKDGYVDFSAYRTGLEYYSYGYEFGLDSPKTNGYANYWNNCVIKYDTDGVTPLNVQLSPVEFNVSTNALTVDCCQNPKIEIVFPGSAAMLTAPNFANRGTATCDSAGEVTATLGTDVVRIKAVAAASLDAGVAAIKAGDAGMLTFTSSGTQSFTGLTEGTTYRLVYLVETDGHGYAFKDGGSFYVPVSNEITLSTANVTACCSSQYAGDNGGVAALTDGDPSTHWHSIYYDAYTTNDPVYGVYFDIDLGASPIQKFQFKFQVRAANAKAAPTSIIYGVSNDGSTWTQVGGTDSTGLTSSSDGGTIVTLTAQDAGSAYRYIRFGIIDSTNGDSGTLTGDLNFTGYKKSVNMAELQLFNLD